MIFITGGTDGIGKAGAVKLATLGYPVAIHGRSKEKLSEAKREIISISGRDNVYTFQADLSNLKEVKQMAEEVNSSIPEIYCLINNAGTFQHEKLLNADGFEMTFTINHLAPFLFTSLVLDKIRQSAPARIINVSSIAHRNAKIDFENMHGEKSYTAYNAYAISKLANILFTNELSRRLEGTGVTVNSLHPGVIETKLLKEGFGVKGGTLEEGCDNSVYLATSDAVAGVTGKYYVKRNISSTTSEANDPKLWKEFWDYSERLLTGYLK